MRRFSLIVFTCLMLSLTSFFFNEKNETEVEEFNIINHEVNPGIQNIRFFWKDENGENYKNFNRLKKSLNSKNEELIFAMNGGMYNKDLSPQGLFIENGKILAKLDTTENGYGNFYLQPNGVFFLTSDNQAGICQTTAFKYNDQVKYATQSGPLLLIDGQIHAKFYKGSKNIHIRNGVGILPDGNILFAMSKEKINFYDLASYFRNRGCKNALYLDGFVSRTYLPQKNWHQLDGNFGVIIGQVKVKN